jgi:predicted metal-dependent hydrolase
MILEKRSISMEGKPIDLIIRRHTQAKAIKIRLNKRDPVIFLILPKYTSVKKALHFFNQSHAWICKHLTYAKESSDFKEGDEIPFLGRVIKIVHTASETQLVGDLLYVKGPQERIHQSVTQWLKDQAYEILHTMSQEVAVKLDVTINSIKVKDMKSRWGSCSTRKDLSYSWRIIMAPEPIAHYLCAHEVSHIREMNHSLKFWALVESVCPEYKASRKWLRREGKTLF